MTGISTKTRGSEGFTLLEVLICMALIAIAFLAVFRLQAQNLDLQSEAQFMTVARFLAQDRLSRIQAEEPLDSVGRSGDFEPTYPNYRYEEEIKDEPGDLENLYRVSVHILRDVGSAERRFSVETLIYRKRT
jgi:type II secretion system protein I